MKKAEIEFVDLGNGDIQIIGIKNVAGFQEIEEQFGYDTALMYFTGRPVFNKLDNSGIVALSDDGRIFSIDPHNALCNIISKEDFSDLLSVLRDSIKRLKRMDKKMKRTEIKYVETDDGHIKITDFKNVCGYEEIKVQYGQRVAAIYSSGRPFYGMYLNRSTRLSSIGISTSTGARTYRVNEGTELTKEEFESFISTLKAAGKRLIDIANANPEEEKTILI
jgi:hypothetical protein